MSEGTDSSAQNSGNGSSGKVSQSAKPKRNLWLMIAAIIVAAILIGVVYYVVVMSGNEEPTPEDHTLEVTIVDPPANVEAGEVVWLNVTMVLDKGTANEKAVTDALDNVTIMWSKAPFNVGDFDVRHLDSVNFTATTVAMSGTISCEVTYTWDTPTGEDEVVASDDFSITVKAPYLASVGLAPSSWEFQNGANKTFTATAVSSVGGVMTSGVTYEWSVRGMPSANYTLNRTTGSTVKFTALNPGNGTLRVNATSGAITKNTTAMVNISGGPPPTRSVDYVWYDMFNVPFGEWWYKRSAEKPWTSSYPYIFKWSGAPPGNLYYYSDLRLNLTVRNITEINMNERPEFLPFLGTARGGNAVIDWYLQYLTSDQCAARSQFIADWNDGWVVELSGTVTLDRQAAKAVLGVTDQGFDDFATWWAANNATVGLAYADWIQVQSSGRLDIFPAYDYDLNPMDWIFWAEKVGTNIVVHMDSVSWGMEIMLARWLHDTFMSTEWYFEDMTFHMNIGPQRTSADIDGVVVYGTYMYESTNIYQGTHGDPTWVWEALTQDYVPSQPPLHPNSTFDKYMPFKYLNTAPGSFWYNQSMDYDYTPGAANLSAGESMKFIWPEGNQTFVCQKFDASGNPVLGEVINITAPMTIDYSEPDEVDLPANVDIDNANHMMTITGPVDMWHWSQGQTRHAWLLSEWQRLHLFPYGAPYIEWKNESPFVAQPNHFEVSGIPTSVIAGEPHGVTVTVYDQSNTVFPGYVGTVHFTSTDGAATLPPDYTFTAGDAGTHTFSVTFGTAGTQSVTATDTVLVPVVDGSQTGITVTAARAATTMAISNVASMPTIGTLLSPTVTVRDQYGAVFAAYRGTVNFTSDRADVVLPANYAFVAGDNGVHTFTSELNFTGLGGYTLTCTDVVAPSLTTTLTNIVVIPGIQEIAEFWIYAPSQVDEGFAATITVVAVNQYGFVFDSYAGTVHFATNATVGQYALPADYTFVAGDLGNRTFAAGMTFTMPGWYSVTVSDTVNTTADGSVNVQVLPRAPEIKYKLYDMFEEPFGAWWWGNNATYKGRIYKYQTDSIISNETHKHTYLYNPDLLSQHAVIMAPYHWSTDARNISWVTVNNPYFMPSAYIDAYGNPAPTTAGAVAQIDIRMQYIDAKWWFSYWVPTLGGGPIVANYLKNQGEGYLIGLVQTVTMNREAAQQWLNLSLSETDVATWWSINGIDYEFFWRDWVWNQGNTVYDIFSSYEDFYYDNFGVVDLTENVATGDVTLVINHVNFGWECLLTRWLTAAGICNHEPYWENVTINATMNTQFTDLHFDATAQYNLHAVRANASAANEGAWVWEPTDVDYVPSWFSSVYHQSDYNPYVNLTYTSWASGDTAGFFGQEASYDSTPNRFNLTDYMTFTVEFPKGSNVPCYLGQSVPVGSVPRAKIPTLDVANYTALMYNGTASLGFTIPALSSMYDAASQTLTIQGPMNFDNLRGIGGLLYHGAPWIEMNVTSTLKTQSVLEVPQLEAGGSAGSAASQMVSMAAVVACGVLLTVAALGAVRKLH